MIKEEYVSFETAKLLKEKGFPQDPNICNTAYTTKGKFSNNAKSFAFNYELIKPRLYYVAPTLQMAVKWLRIKHNLCVTPVMASKTLREKYGYWEADIYYHKGEFAGIDATINACGHIFGETPEKVLEEGIKYCLENLI